MILGINLSHESSLALTDNFGRVLFALEEERLSRVKRPIGLPINALNYINDHPNLVSEIEMVIIGSHQNFSGSSSIDIWNKVNAGSLSNKTLTRDSFSELFLSLNAIEKKFKTKNPKEIVELSIRLLLEEKLHKGVQFIWINHHDAHLGCALGASGLGKSLLVSMDGEGDGESGAIAWQENRDIHSRVTVMSDLDSLGLLYSAVTRKYDFKSGRHEGKITGLAAYGSYSAATEVLLNAISIRSGRLNLRYTKSNSSKGLLASLRAVGLRPKIYKNISEIVDAAAEKIEIYPDLANAVQQVLEDSTLEICKYWLAETETNKISLAGGVFANVKLNQRIADLEQVHSVNVFPNMGDGGLSLGGIWHYLSKSSALSKDDLYQDMYLGFNSNESDCNLNGIFSEQMSKEKIFTFCAEQLVNGKYIGLHQGRLEFGPRALGNRSIIFDPRSSQLGPKLNKRLKRTEFMPFAPAILEEHFSVFMETSNGSLQPFKSMTMTCNVRENYRKEIPAVVHIDGTARPQVVTKESNEIFFGILNAFYKLTSIPLLVNTSFNVHEEPINGILQDSIDCLRSEIVDYVVTEEAVYSNKPLN
jgi:carbamoyltransferase